LEDGVKEGAIGRFVAIVRGLRGVVLDTGIVYISAALLSGVSIVVLPRELLWSGYGKARLVLKNGAVIEAVGEREVDELLARYRGQTAAVTLSGGQARGLIVAVVASSAIAMIGYSVLRLKGELWRLLRFDRRAAVLGCGLAAAVFGIMFWLERSLLPGGAGLCQLLHSLTLREFSVVLILVGLVAPFAEEVFFRGQLMERTKRVLGAVPSILLTSVIFSAAHAGSSALYSVAWVVEIFAFVFGVALAVLRLHTGSLAGCIIAHGLYNSLSILVAWREVLSKGL